MIQVIAELRIDREAQLYEKLDAAVAAAQSDAAADGRYGVLVTRHDFGHFSVALSPDVPFGLICEDDQACRN